jgi:hypothetical protein
VSKKPIKHRGIFTRSAGEAEPGWSSMFVVSHFLAGASGLYSDERRNIRMGLTAAITRGRARCTLLRTCARPIKTVWAIRTSDLGG